jgi:hypothetical protein
MIVGRSTLGDLSHTPVDYFLVYTILASCSVRARLGSKSSTIHVTGDPHKNTCGAGERPAMESGNTYWITAGSVFLILVRVHYKVVRKPTLSLSTSGDNEM